MLSNTAVLTISRYFEEHPYVVLEPANRRCLGICTGLLAAAAIVSAKSLSDLNVVGLEAVRLAFRTGFCASIAGDAEEKSQGESWSTLIADISSEKAAACLNDFHNNAKVHKSSEMYISCFGWNSVTLSGPPGTAKSLFETSEELKHKIKLQLPIFSPYHAKHLFQPEDIIGIIDDETRAILDNYQPIGLVYSAASGKPLQAKSTSDLFQAILNEILCEPVHWDQLLNSITHDAKSVKPETCRVFSIGSNTLSGSLMTSFRNAGVQSVMVEDKDAWKITLQVDTTQTQSDKIAIVGMAGRFPNAANHEELWDLLTQGLDVHKEIPKDRFDAQAHYDASGKGKNKSHTLYGCFIDEPGLFDPRFFNMSPREAAQTDPMGRLALVTAYEALEMSGYTPNRTPSTKLNRIGTFYGQTSDDWREINAAENIDTYFITGGVRAFAPGRINYFFKFGGPSFSIDTACSSSLAAIQLACTSLLAGDCDAACAGGVNVLTNPDIFSGLSKGQFLSKTGSCKTFDNEADGYCRGDGCGTLILKRYQDAVADKDNILGCILSAATNHSAEAISITHPHAGAQEFLYRKVLADAGVAADEVSYCELHGTGTQAGDHIEMESITNVFAPQNSPRKQDRPLFLGSLKANIGHGEAASGLSAMVKCLMMLREDIIPPNVGIKGIINQTFPKDLTERNVHIPRHAVHLPRNESQKRKILVNNFSAAGGNTVVLLEEAQMPSKPSALDPRSKQIVTVSARGMLSLKKNLNNLIKYLDDNPDTDLPSLSYTTTARRMQHNYRISITASDMVAARKALLAQTKDEYRPIPVAPMEVIFVFTGQGAQYAGLGRQLYADLASFKSSINSLDKLVRLQGMPSFMPLITNDEISSLSPVIVQLGLACIQVSLARMWESWGVKPKAVIGHSLGEYAALHVAGVLSANAMIRLVGYRAQLLVSHCTPSTHGMLAVNANENAILNILDSRMLDTACKNSPSQTVLSGTVDSINIAARSLEKAGLKTTLLEVPFAFHSAQVDPILKDFQNFARSVTFEKPQIPILSPLTGSVITSIGEVGPEYLARHAREPVDFCAALNTGAAKNLFNEKTAWLEIGPHPICSSMIKSTLEYMPRTFSSLKKNEDAWQTISSSVCGLYDAGVSIGFNEYHSSFADAHQLLVLPTYAFDNKTYWLDYHNNWTLTKGEVTMPMKELKPVIETPKLSTTSCQRIVFEDLGVDTGKVIVQSDITEPKLAAILAGHLVNGVRFCPSTLYADMALTISHYLYEQLQSDKSGKSEIGMNVCNMEVFKALVAVEPPPPEGQHIQVEATADLKAGEVQIKYRSVSPEGKLIIEHGACSVRFESVRGWQDTWETNQYMVQTQIDILKQKLETGSAHKVLRGLAYKLFRALVTYDPKFQGMEEIIFDNKETEATAEIAFQADHTSGTFFCSPYWIDSLCHLSGFVVNATDLIDSDESVFISHGWKTMRFARPFSAGKRYQSYVRMQLQPKNIRAGDVYIFEDNEIIGVVGGVKFQQVPRKVLDIMLPRKNPTPTDSRPPTTVKKPVLGKKLPAVPAVPASAAPPSQKSQSLVSRALEIIADETGLDKSELVAEAAFVHLGVDSLMSLSMASRFQEELGIEVTASLFTDYETIGAMTEFFSQNDESSDLVQSPTPPRMIESSSSEAEMQDSGDESGDSSSSTSASSAGSMSDTVRQVIAQEMCIDVEELIDDADLASMGMDSLMSLTILAALRENSGIDLTPTFLAKNTTIKDIEIAMNIRTPPTPKSLESNLTKASQVKRQIVSSVRLSDRASTERDASKFDPSNYPAATSMLMQGSSKVATKNLFLLPDGSGSATS